MLSLVETLPGGITLCQRGLGPGVACELFSRATLPPFLVDARYRQPRNLLQQRIDVPALRPGLTCLLVPLAQTSLLSDRHRIVNPGEVLVMSDSPAFPPRVRELPGAYAILFIKNRDSEEPAFRDAEMRELEPGASLIERSTLGHTIVLLLDGKCRMTYWVGDDYSDLDFGFGSRMIIPPGLETGFYNHTDNRRPARLMFLHFNE